MKVDAKKSYDDYKDLIPELAQWLGDTGLYFFRELKEKYGNIDCCYIEGGMPHPVHFREGIKVRNKLRELTNNTWTVYEYDNTWAEIIDKCI